MRPLAAALVTAVAVLAAAAPAGAQSAGQAPPGSAAVDQYRESIPATPGGTRKPTKRQREALAAQGRDGRELAATLAATGTDDASTGGKGADASSTGADAASAPDSRSSASGAGDAAAPGEREDGRDDGTAAGRGTRQNDGAAPGRGADDAVRDGAAPSKLSATASASLGSKFGPVPLWVALTAILVAAVGTALLRRRTA